VRTVTVVYQIVDQLEWEKVNPLRYQHNGLQAVRVGIGDALDARDALSELIPFVAYPFYPPSDFKAAMDHANTALRFGEAEKAGDQ